jgi:hypothetical protein
MLRRIAALVAALIALLIAPAVAEATSASLYPAGHTLDVTAQTERTLLSGIMGSIRCTYDAGAARIPAEPANRNETGPLRLTLSTLPGFESCRGSGWTATVTASGSWTAEWTWGAPAVATWNVPARGIAVRLVLEGVTLCEGTNTSAAAIRGSWQNGFTSPVFVTSAMSLSGRASGIAWTGNEQCGSWFGSSMNLELATVEVRDTTNARAVILVGP